MSWPNGTWEQRAALGEALATDLDGDGAEEQVMRLLLDPEDTAVTFRTAVALPARRDVRGIRLVARADARADDQTGDQIYAAFAEISACSLGADDDLVLAALHAVADGTDQEAAGGAAGLLSLLEPR